MMHSTLLVGVLAALASLCSAATGDNFAVGTGAYQSIQCTSSKQTTADDATCRALCGARPNCEGYAILGNDSCYTCTSFAVTGFGGPFTNSVTAGFLRTCADADFPDNVQCFDRVAGPLPSGTNPQTRSKARAKRWQRVNREQAKRGGEVDLILEVRDGIVVEQVA